MTETYVEESPEEADFRQRARRWLVERALRRDSIEVLQDLRPVFHADRLAAGYPFHRELYEAGFAGITWPVEYGGQGLSSPFQEIWAQEAAPYALPPHGNGAAMGIAAPMLLAHGSELLKLRHVPSILRAEECWCQFLSEPSGGSDLAGLRTIAIRDGDEFVLNGSKIWTTGAHFSQFAMCLARTDPDVPKHRGLTMFVVPIPSEGLEIRPIVQITGESEFNQEFLDNVRVPVENVIGDINDGWRVAQTMLSFERQMIGEGTLQGGRTSGEPPHELVELAVQRGLAGDSHVRQALADLWVRSVVSAEASARAMARVRTGNESPHVGSALKLFGTELTRQRAHVAMMLAGTRGIAWPDDEALGESWARSFLSSRSAGIGGGTDEIQRNIVGERILGLARDIQVDRNIPFRDVPTSRRS